ncbi:MAG TPA: tetratricopeptide repeat protein [Armatimonadota bacterium]
MAELYNARAVKSFEAGLKEAQSGEITRAITLFEKALQQQPNYLQAKVALAHAYGQEGLFAQAITLFQEALEIDPNDYFVLMSISTTFILMGDISNALGYFERLIDTGELIPLDILEPIADALLYDNRLEYVHKVIARLQRVTATIPEAYPILADLYYGLHDLPAARAANDAWLSLNPDDVVSLMLRGTIALEDAQPDAALDPLLHANTLEPNNPGIEAMTSLAYLRLGDQQKARTFLHAALAYEENSPEILSISAEIYEGLGELDHAIAALRESLELDGNDDEAITKLIALAVQVGDAEPLKWLRDEIVLEDEEDLLATINAAMDLIAEQRPNTPARKKKKR